MLSLMTNSRRLQRAAVGGFGASEGRRGKCHVLRRDGDGDAGAAGDNRDHLWVLAQMLHLLRSSYLHAVDPVDTDDGVAKAQRAGSPSNSPTSPTSTR